MTPNVKMLLALAPEELRSTAQGLIVPDMKNGQYGWLLLSRRARWKAQRISKASRLTVRSFAVR
ncbi:MAG: hypothetical protein ABSE28_20745 [Candidatus Sulfotelmatobacter sp.]|jgi:hypothetical protein